MRRKFHPTTSTDAMLIAEYCADCLHDIDQSCPIVLQSLLADSLEDMPDEWTAEDCTGRGFSCAKKQTLGGRVVRYGSVCSGIEAATVAWEPLGWQCAWLSEIEPFPCRVLDHHYPDVPNLGDMTKIADRILAEEVEAPDILCGGTPCQSFSISGHRKGLDDDRGQLSLAFCKLADAIDTVRQRRGEPPAIVVWENVPGVLSSDDGAAFGSFIGFLAGSRDALRVPGGGIWDYAGAVYGPRRAIAWRTLDAQYFGVAQRRRRVWVVASARPGFDPAEILFESEGMRRDSPPRREAGEGFADNAQACFGGNRTGGAIDVAPALVASDSPHGRQDFASEAFVAETAPTICNEGKAAGSLTQQAAESGGAIVVQERACSVSPTSGPGGKGWQKDVAYTLEARHKVQSVCYDPSQVTSPENRSNPQPGASCHTLPSEAQAPICVTGGYTHALTAEGHDASEDGIGRGTPICVHPTQDPSSSEDITHAITNGSTGGQCSAAVTEGLRVRRLMPVECERLQGFPDGYTDIPGAKDGPRYKAIGNSWAVPCARWIGQRIAKAVAA